MGLENRIRRLEGRDPLPCAECGVRTGERVEWKLAGHSADPDNPLVVYCPGCASVKSFTLDISGSVLHDTERS